MPHQCTTCGQTFENGSKEMLSGCPECGGNKFQFIPSDAVDETAAEPESTTAQPPERPDEDGSVTDAVGRAATTVRDYVSNRHNDSQSHSDAPTNDRADAIEPGRDDEDEAQASARGEMVDRSELPDDTGVNSADPPAEGRVVDRPDGSEEMDQPALEELRQELNEQFESIRIVAPGQYELNLMELYDREEHIIALQEDGKYIIQVPDSWRDDDSE
ncbi:OapC/ArvC family zinc-ribbon domain-containing protein [Halanaeroarchaeum sulfurireducens]|uniref:Zn-ribbon containing protein (DUF2072) n=1 Tax=Halanaeroarchaeum sulfurireducens TaxID=1604004 RepID=A0A0F7PG89_9EURY|nr:Zn-ribbon containing protein [Halanaeroarchaeum sulfurireducens]AKH98624.1 Zn-ribbon containing protein (DUF2072) [Halanaeroarchaeum sulfurireducens]ALG83066.1 Zn-ribbon containing protein (DUF2072) [Halanaeroarchaeum sulfurireducens]